MDSSQAGDVTTQRCARSDTDRATRSAVYCGGGQNTDKVAITIALCKQCRLPEQWLFLGICAASRLLMRNSLQLWGGSLSMHAITPIRNFRTWRAKGGLVKKCLPGGGGGGEGESSLVVVHKGITTGTPDACNNHRETT